MTLQECYVKIGGDYNDILHRFMNENMVRKFVLKFPQDNNMALFEESWAKKDYETAFRAMHTLKGVAVNLGFTALYNVSSALTEKLRSQEYDNLDGLIADVKKQYDIVIEAIAALGYKTLTINRKRLLHRSPFLLCFSIAFSSAFPDLMHRREPSPP